MDLLQDQADLERNPIYRLLVNYDLIQNVAGYVFALADPRLQACKLDIQAIHKRIESRFFGIGNPGSSQAPSSSVWKGLTSEQLVACSQQVIGDVCEFVVAVLEFYRVLRSFRPLNAEEKEHGNHLRALVTSLQELLPT